MQLSTADLLDMSTNIGAEMHKSSLGKATMATKCLLSIFFDGSLELFGPHEVVAFHLQPLSDLLFSLGQGRLLVELKKR